MASASPLRSGPRATWAACLHRDQAHRGAGRSRGAWRVHARRAARRRREISSIPRCDPAPSSPCSSTRSLSRPARVSSALRWIDTGLPRAAVPGRGRHRLGARQYWIDVGLPELRCRRRVRRRGSSTARPSRSTTSPHVAWLSRERGWTIEVAAHGTTSTDVSRRSTTSCRHRLRPRCRCYAARPGAPADGRVRLDVTLTRRRSPRPGRSCVERSCQSSARSFSPSTEWWPSNWWPSAAWPSIGAWSSCSCSAWWWPSSSSADGRLLDVVGVHQRRAAGGVRRRAGRRCRPAARRRWRPGRPRARRARPGRGRVR